MPHPNELDFRLPLAYLFWAEQRQRLKNICNEKVVYLDEARNLIEVLLRVKEMIDRGPDYLDEVWDEFEEIYANNSH